MREKAVQAAIAQYTELVAAAEAVGQELTQPWPKVRAAVADNPSTAHLVGHLPGRLDRAVTRSRKARLLRGRPPHYVPSPEKIP